MTRREPAGRPAPPEQAGHGTGAGQSPSRRPRWVYGSGTEPDYRFSFANERTFLAWIRTALALLAAGVAVDAFDLSTPAWLQHALAVLLVTFGLVSALASWLRWARAERAMRRAEPLTPLGFGAVLAVAIGVTAAALLALGL